MPNIQNYKDDPNVGRCPHCDCPNPYCACVLTTRLENQERLAAEHLALADHYRTLWQHAAGFIMHHAPETKPRGPDERRMLEHAAQCMLDRGAWSGKSNGWIPNVK